MSFIKYTNEKHKRSMVKSILWRVLGVIFLALLAYFITGSLLAATLVTVLHHGIFLIVYYLHERFWLWFNHFKDSKWRPMLRVLLYEIVLGNLILGTITLLITGSWLMMSLITFIYIGNKLWMYVAYDKMWETVSWGKKGKELK